MTGEAMSARKSKAPRSGRPSSHPAPGRPHKTGANTSRGPKAAPAPDKTREPRAKASRRPAARAVFTAALEGPAKAAFSWFPPHMHRAQLKLLQEVRRVDLIIEVRDARLPAGSANPELERIAAGKPRLLLINKASLADPAANRAWAAHFQRLGQTALFTDAERPGNAQRVRTLALRLTEPAREAFAKRGIRAPEPRVIVLGIPNVGKSTLINRLLRRKRLATGPEPGVTRSSQWVPLHGSLLMLDTPGVLLPRIAHDEDALRLAWIGAIPAHLLGPELLAHALLRRICSDAPVVLATAYPGPAPAPTDPAAWLAELARRRGFLVSGGQPDLTRAAEQLLRDFREGLLGRHSLEWPETL